MNKEGNSEAAGNSGPPSVSSLSPRCTRGSITSGEEAKSAREFLGQVRSKAKKQKQKKSPPPLAAGISEKGKVRRETMGEGEEENVLSLLQLWVSGDRDGCLAAISRTSPTELDRPLSPALSHADGGDAGATLLLLAVQREEVAVVAALLAAGSAVVRTQPSPQRPRGRDPWSQACQQGNREIVELLLPHIRPASHPLALMELIGVCGGMAEQLEALPLPGMKSPSSSAGSKGNRYSTAKQQDGAHQHKEGERDKEGVGLLATLSTLLRAGRVEGGWAQATSEGLAALSSEARESLPPTALHLAVIRGLPATTLEVMRLLE